MEKNKKDIESIVRELEKGGHKPPYTITSIDTRDDVWIPGEAGFHNVGLAFGKDKDNWKIQWKALLRWKWRIEYLGIANDKNIEDIIDYLHAFVLVCFHLKDYVDLSISEDLNKDSCMLFCFPEFLICRDIANGLKHLKLNKPSLSEKIGFYRAYDYTRDCHVIKVTFYSEKKQYSYEHKEFIDRSILIWKKFLQQVGLNGKVKNDQKT